MGDLRNFLGFIWYFFGIYWTSIWDLPLKNQLSWPGFLECTKTSKKQRL